MFWDAGNSLYAATEWPTGSWPWIWTQNLNSRKNGDITYSYEQTAVKVATWAGHFLKMLNKMNLQQWHCQGQAALPSRLSALSINDPSHKHEGWLWKFFYTWLVLTSANILPDMSIFRVRSHSCTANRQCSKCATQFPVCSPCRNTSESII